jgi:hypothetical protein
VTWPGGCAKARAKIDHAAWSLLEREHRALVEELPEHAFAARFGRWTGEAVISGAAAHDLYDAGQIQLLRKLAAGKSLA